RLDGEAVARGVPQDLEPLEGSVAGTTAGPHAGEARAQELVLGPEPLDPFTQGADLHGHRAPRGGTDAPTGVGGGDDAGDGDQGLEHRGRVLTETRDQAGSARRPKRAGPSRRPSDR